MATHRPLVHLLLMALLLTFVTATVPGTTVVSADCQEDLAQARAELNATRAELEEVRGERDDYAQRLEDATTIMILVIFLLAGSYVVFYVQGRRQKVVLMELERRAGVSVTGSEPRPRRRRRG